MKIKIVPESTPNADGKWIDIAAVIPESVSGWRQTENFLSPHVPDGFMLVAVEGDRRG